MNCQEFDAIVVDFVRGNLQPAATREDLVDHASNCLGCAARLSEESILTAGLRAWAESSGCDPALERLEAPLLAAFRAHTPLHAARRVAERRMAKFKWAAAGILIFLASTLAFLQEGGIRSTSGSLPSAAGIASAVPVETATASEVQFAPSLANRTPLRRLAAQPKRPVARRADARAAANQVEEITTGFIPLPYGSSLNLWEDGPSAKIHLIRMRLPRSALLRTGLPMNEERASEPVLADVLFTEDGLARGIRFIN